MAGKQKQTFIRAATQNHKYACRNHNRLFYSCSGSRTGIGLASHPHTYFWICKKKDPHFYVFPSRGKEVMLMNATVMKADERPRRRDMPMAINGAGGLYRPSEAEIDRYKQHGMAMLRFARMHPFPSGTARIDVAPLLEAICGGAGPRVGKPAEAWIKRGEMPTIIISAGIQGRGSKSHVKIDGTKELAFLKFEYCPKVSDNQVMLEPIYR